MTQTAPPVLLCIGGHDPSGGAGIAADIETARALGCQPITLITALTRQNSHNVEQIHPNPPQQFAQQADCLLQDIPAQVIKIGLVGSEAMIDELLKLLEHLPTTPVVLDPILAAGSGTPLAQQRSIERIAQELAPTALLLTPNQPEQQALQQAGYKRQAHQWLLTSGGHAPGSGPLTHRLEGPKHQQHFRSERLTGQYHGSGCTLATACAAHIAHGLSVPEAVDSALNFTHQALLAATHPGHGQAIPQRIQARTAPRHIPPKPHH